jgi:redox-sensitive bicupin YhaK (pirin superfamily)
MRAAGGVWHTGGVAGTARAKGYQLWIALPPEMESIESAAQYLGGEHFQSQGPARVILGRYGEASSKVSAPTTINYLDVALKKGEKWRYDPPGNHTVAWIAVHEGALAVPGRVEKGELAVFEESNDAIEFEALDDTGFIVGSAVKHPHDLVLGNYSVHTSSEALRRGKARIEEIGERLRAEGRL